MTCLIPAHVVCPDLKYCKDCIKEYEDCLDRWYGPEAVTNFRAKMQLEAIRCLA